MLGFNSWPPLELVSMECSPPPTAGDVIASGCLQGQLRIWDDAAFARFAPADAVVSLAVDPVACHGSDALTGPNVDAVLNTFEAVARNGVNDLLFTSSNQFLDGHQAGEPIPVTPERPAD